MQLHNFEIKSTFVYNVHQSAGSVRDHVDTVTADEQLELNDKFIPTGKLEDQWSCVNAHLIFWPRISM